MSTTSSRLLALLSLLQAFRRYEAVVTVHAPARSSPGAFPSSPQR